MRKAPKPNFTNRPPHVKQDNSYYFFTVRTVRGLWLLRPDSYKEILLKVIKEKVQKYDYTLIAYSILNNHYHLLIKVTDAGKISRYIAEMNGASTHGINDADGTIYRKIWWNYYDHVVRNEADFFKHLNYIHQNAVKHELCKELDYKFSSYRTWLEKKGQEYMDNAFTKYPVIDFLMKGDEF